MELSSEVHQLRRCHHGCSSISVRPSTGPTSLLKRRRTDIGIRYYPPPCELEKILKETIAFCDPLDGRSGGVVARTDLCKLQSDINSIVGVSYSWPDRTPTVLGTWEAPVQEGVVTPQGAAVASLMIDGPS